MNKIKYLSMQYFMKYWKVLAVAAALIVAYGVGKHSFHPAPALPSVAHMATAHKPTTPGQTTVVAILAKLSAQDRAVMVRALRASRTAVWQHPTQRIAFHPPAKHKVAKKHSTAHKKHKTSGKKKTKTK